MLEFNGPQETCNLMKTVFSLALVLFAGMTHANATVGDFALLDQTGRFHQLSYYGDHQAVALLTSAGADAGADAGALAAAVESADEGAAIAFLLDASSGRGDLPQTPALPVLVDESQLVTEVLGLSRVGELIIIDPRTMEIRYRGDGADAGATLSRVLAGEAVDAAPPDGAAIAFTADPDRTISYTQDIAPILEANCVQCHHEGGIGSWPMNSHAMVRGWSPMMREVIMTRRMPPGQVDPHVGKPLLEMGNLTIQEKQDLVHWINAGSPVDGDVDPLAGLSFTKSRFTLGEPDMVFNVPPQTIPATGVVDYRYVPVQLNLDRDVWVRAMEFVPGDKQVLHHVIAYVSSPADRSVRGRETGAAQGESVGGFAPGRKPDQFRDDSGRLLRKGSNLLLQMHYTTSGRETVDETVVALYLHDQPPKYVMSGGVAGQRRFLVPPHVKEHKLEGEQLIERDAYLYSMAPHMHYRGKYMSYTAEYPDGTSEVLLSVPKYDFNWQFSYDLAEPAFLPAGTRLVARGAMDNSSRNPGNPDPSKPVHFGLQTKHEMFFGFTTLRYVGDTPENIVSTPETEEGPEGDNAAGR